MSLFAGCSKNSDTPGSKTDSSGSLIDQTKPAATTAKYAYQADYLDLQLPENIQYVNTMCTAGTTIFLTAYVQGDEIVQTDPDTGDTWSYYAGADPSVCRPRYRRVHPASQPAAAHGSRGLRGQR